MELVQAICAGTGADQTGQRREKGGENTDNSPRPAAPFGLSQLLILLYSHRFSLLWFPKLSTKIFGIIQGDELG